MRDALSIFDQVASFTQKNITYAEVLDNLNVLDYEYYFRMTEAFLNRIRQPCLAYYLMKSFNGVLTDRIL